MPGDHPADVRGDGPGHGLHRTRRQSQRRRRTGILGPQIGSALKDADLRDWTAKDVIPAFLKTNVATLGAITALAILDEVNIAWDWIAAGDRIISAQVIMALLGATTVQVGAIAVLIARYLFPGRPP